MCNMYINKAVDCVYASLDAILSYQFSSPPHKSPNGLSTLSREQHTGQTPTHQTSHNNTRTPMQAATIKNTTKTVTCTANSFAGKRCGWRRSGSRAHANFPKFVHQTRLQAVAKRKSLAYQQSTSRWPVLLLSKWALQNGSMDTAETQEREAQSGWTHGHRGHTGSHTAMGVIRTHTHTRTQTQVERERYIHRDYELETVLHCNSHTQRNSSGCRSATAALFYAPTVEKGTTIDTDDQRAHTQ